MPAGKYVPLLFVILAAACTQRERPPLPGDGSAAPGASAVASSPSPARVITDEPVFRPPPAIDAAPAIPPAEWVWKPYRGDHYSVLFPGEPKVDVLPAEDDKAGFSEAVFEVPGGQVSFAAGFTEHPQAAVAKPDEFLDERINAPRRGFTDLLHKRSTSLPGGQPGRVLIQRRNISGTPLRVYSRLYLVGRRLYSLIVSTLDEGGISEDVVKKFMDSFKLV